MITVGSRFSLLGVGLLAAGLAAFGARPARADLFVSCNNFPAGNTVLQFDEKTGDFLSDFISEGGLGPRMLLWGPDGNFYVAASSKDAVARFDSNGNSLGYFVASGSAGISGPRGIIFGADGNLYVSNTYGNNSVERFDGKTGMHIDTFVAPGSNGLNQPKCMLFGPDGNLYVADYGNGQVQKYDGQTGASLGVFTQGDGGLGQQVNGFCFGPDGNLYVGRGGTHNILRYDSNGNFMDIFVQDGSPLNDPNGVLFGPDGNLYVGDNSGGGVLQYDGKTGDFLQYIADPSITGSSTTFVVFTKTDPTTLNYKP